MSKILFVAFISVVLLFVAALLIFVSVVSNERSAPQLRALNVAQQSLGISQQQQTEAPQQELTDEPQQTCTCAQIVSAILTAEAQRDATKTAGGIVTSEPDVTAEPTVDSAPTDLPTVTETPTSTETSVDTGTPVPTDTPSPTDTSVPSSTPTALPTDTPVPTLVPTSTPLPTKTNTPVPTNTSTSTPLPTNTFTPTIVPTVAPPINVSGIKYGLNFTHVPGQTCSLDNRGIVQFYDVGNNRALVKDALNKSVESGQKFLRLLLWFDATPPTVANWDTYLKWGVVPAPNGSLSPKYQTNLLNYIQDVKDAGFTDVEIAFASQGKGYPDSASFDVSTAPSIYQVMKNVRNTLKQTYPTINFTWDLSNENSPSTSTASALKVNRAALMGKIYPWWVADFGTQDMTISSAEDEWGNETNSFIQWLQANKLPYPAFFSPHIYTRIGDRRQITKKTLDWVEIATSRAGLTGIPLRISETFAKDQPTALGIGDYMTMNPKPNHRIDIVAPWPQTFPTDCSLLTAPLSTYVYESALNGIKQ